MNGAVAGAVRRPVLRCCASVGPGQHPDWPSERYQGLRDEDVLELESFLRVFRERRALLPGPDEQGPGEVHLVGTGPGDPGLLTLRAVQLMQTADVVLYDRLVSDEILNMVGPHARMVYVGKHSGFHTRSQEEIHALLLAFAEAGATVIRLKGGDPYVFGRGGEEVQYLAARGITVHSVPGITAAAGICSELGIPMTHRGVATSARFLTGHARDGGEQELLDSTVVGAADPHTTLIVYMGLHTLPKLYAQLAAHGMPRSTPAVAVERGTTARQRVVWGAVGELPAAASAMQLKSPTLIIIGQVVALAPGWQAWDAAGRPAEWRAPAPRHGYALPRIDAAQLHACAEAQEARRRAAVGAGSGGGGRGEGGIPLRELGRVLPAVAAAAAAPAAVMAAAGRGGGGAGSASPSPLRLPSTAPTRLVAAAAAAAEAWLDAPAAMHAPGSVQAGPGARGVGDNDSMGSRSSTEQYPAAGAHAAAAHGGEQLEEEQGDGQGDGLCDGEMCEMDWGEEEQGGEGQPPGDGVGVTQV